MGKNKELETIKSKHFTYEQKKYLPLKQPDLTKLSARDIRHTDEVPAQLSDKNAKEIKDYSHNNILYMVAKDSEPISCETKAAIESQNI